ncbi:hypothetical protein GCM10022222_85100 [Amycolatopsis ultiminotia]|uniref:Uncharacterized protein n=1 Tax=Amycolatopsis ultiminotia TaxID=543629 RepID=A0ABP6YNP6_9PSEU
MSVHADEDTPNSAAETMMPANIDGKSDERFGALRETFEDELSHGDELGASVAVTIDGEFAVDL